LVQVVLVLQEATKTEAQVMILSLVQSHQQVAVEVQNLLLLAVLVAQVEALVQEAEHLVVVLVLLLKAMMDSKVNLEPKAEEAGVLVLLEAVEVI
jgi:hypothetical protein